ncbi:hypothetical protein LTS08_001611 [Lithohypha guttulata]|nr:hypothetical protein LTS08_001611 [Lithohypha guttulata]
MARVSPFSHAVVASMRHLYPEVLADKSFDNTGLLLEAPIPTHLPRKSNSVLLTIDLTKAVADEAIEENHSLVVAYHPIIFRGLKSITLDDSQQQSLLRLASHGVSVYCPHTAVDIVPNVTGKIEPAPEPMAVSSAEAKQQLEDTIPEQSEPVSETDVTTSEDEEPITPSDVKPNGHMSDPFVEKDPTTPKPKPKRPTGVHRTYSKPSYPLHIRDQEEDSPPHRIPSPIQSSPNTTFHHSVIPHVRTVITSSPSSALETANAARSTSQGEPYYTSSNSGSGRLITFEHPQPLSALITRIAYATGTPKGFPVAIPQDRSLESIRIKTVGTCPGSGSSVIRNAKTPPDLVFTGEMSHHEALAAIEQGRCVISLFHSNSERGYLDGVMRELLEEEVQKRWKDERERTKAEDNQGEMTKEITGDDSVSVVVSRRDRDPFGIVVLQESGVRGEAVS